MYFSTMAYTIHEFFLGITAFSSISFGFLPLSSVPSYPSSFPFYPYPPFLCTPFWVTGGRALRGPGFWVSPPKNVMHFGINTLAGWLLSFVLVCETKLMYCGSGTVAHTASQWRRTRQARGCHVESVTSYPKSDDPCSLEEQSCQISSRSDLKRQT